MLREADIENPSVDAFYLLEHAAGLNRTRYLMFKDQQVTKRNIDQYMALIERRQSRIPYQYILGTADFAGLTFEVNPTVLIPRLDTEVLFEQALRSLGPGAYVLDLCTGSGALGIALKRYRPDIHMVLSDISPEVLEVAERNISHNHMERARKLNCAADPKDIEYGYDLNYCIRLVQSDLFADMDNADTESKTEKAVVGRFDVIVSNPPYVTEEEYEHLQPEVKNHEPKLALTAGEDGLDMYRRIIREAPDFLKPKGKLLLEIGCSQAAAVTGLLKDRGFQDIRVIQDLAELDRVVTAYRPE